VADVQDHDLFGLDRIVYEIRVSAGRNSSHAGFVRFLRHLGKVTEVIDCAFDARHDSLRRKRVLLRNVGEYLVDLASAVSV
jgi:hypothetical protein